ncbi:MAG: T9SS type A sorting domain-containing protein [Bacteroidales bacterium]|nr:T9SS type A sorting domain-containing protein [Bacteroidales bacterium]
MKKSIILVLFMVCAFVMNAQNYFDFVREGNVYHNADTIAAELGSGVGCYFFMGATNLTDQNLEVIAKIEPINANGISVSGICAGGRCMTGRTESNPFTINAGQTDDQVYPEFDIAEDYPGGQYGTFKMSITNTANSSISSYVVLKVYRTMVGIENVAGNVSMKAYPNPAANSVRIQYVAEKNISNAKVVLYDVKGNCLNEVPVSAQNGDVTLDLSNLASGVYMYGVVANGVRCQFQKLMVR